ncbi:MAG: pyruvate orthophosphate dikinase [Bacteroidetes bacterium]|nr:MAG: pyruvate orthophosphate dikinase [Bacteroidota bacterium]
MSEQFISKALEANLAETRYRDIYIPEEHQQFIQLSVSYFGIKKRANDCITEYHHPLSNRKFVIEELREILITDLWFYTKDEIPANALLIPLKMLEKMLGERLPVPLTTTIIRTILEFISLLMKKNPRHQELILPAISILDNNISVNTLSYNLSTKYLVRYLPSVAAISDYESEIHQFIMKVFNSCYDFWESSSAIELWIKKNNQILDEEALKLAEQLGSVYFEELRLQLGLSLKSSDLLSNLTVYESIAERFAASADLLNQFIHKFQYVFYLLHLPGMDIIGERLIWSLDKLIRQTMDELKEDEVLPYVDLIFNLADEMKLSHTSAVLDFLQTLGLKVIDIDKSEHKELINHFEKKLIGFGFISPGTVYVDEDWQLSVNTNHIKNIRVWLQLIESSQSGMEKLLSALIVNLRLGGIFISDTDLFQREITKVLNSNIAPYYKKVKQLTRIFPVYFNEIGAEGEIRKVTTTMDEISGRQDKLVHFLRKQVHTESNNTLIGLTLKIFKFWFDGNLDKLKPFLPHNVYNAVDKESEWFAPIHSMLKELCVLNQSDPEGLLMLSQKAFDSLLHQLGESNQHDKERLHDIHSLYAHLREKYSFESVNIIQLLQRYPFISEVEIEKLDKALKNNDFKRSLRLIYSFMDRLRKIIFNPEESESWENIYHKRHIAIGIPSMYGVYRENKFEALGLTFRLEKVATRLMEKVVERINLDYISATTLEEIYVILDYFREGLELDGITNQSFNSNLQMLKYSLTSRSFSFDQYINIFQFIAQDIRRIIIKHFLKSYEYPLKVVVPQLFDPSQTLSEKEMNQLLVKKSEEFHRDVIAEAFLVQPLDNFISKILYSLGNMSDKLDKNLINDIMTYNNELVISPLDERTPKMDNQVFLGSKAYHLKNLYLKNFPVPPGFVITSEVFRRNTTIMALGVLRKELHELVHRQIARIERLSGKKFGDPSNPLMLSVRSGTAISMPGAMDTILNVGLNDELVEKISNLQNYSWSVWDSYRRLLQSWGMAHGIDRDTFDKVMSDFKKRLKVGNKVEFESADMRSIALAYKKVLSDKFVDLEQNLFKQLMSTINIVFESWSSERAYVYRKHLQISDNWGTAVIVQQMIFGNLHDHSGTGVLFTQNPKRGRPGVHLYGDFTSRSQGEDIVSGLVKPMPVSETQRKQADLQGPSLQTQYPAIYKRLFDLASDLTENHGYSPQEIEFTFESENPDDLYILQTRDQELDISQETMVFLKSPDEMVLLGRGIGIGGGAMNGIAAFDEKDIEMLRTTYPDDHVILIRPDTVPDDIGMIFACDGLLTARGGATSHAAVTAVRLGKICVVNCSSMLVDEQNKSSDLDGRRIYTGDKISIDGTLGNIYLGHYPVELTSREEGYYY